MGHPAALRQEIQTFLGLQLPTGNVDFEVHETTKEEHYERQLITYLGSEADLIPAYLFLPREQPIIGAVLAHHQHNSERHIGKSEVAGIVGDRLQFFGPELARRGMIVLTPDSICFEDRRTNKQGFEPAEAEEDALQHYNELCYRLLRGDTLMKKVLEDSFIAVSVLQQIVEEGIKIGLLGHSYGGNTVIFHTPFDDRIALACTSGAVCSYRQKMKVNTGIEMAEVIPGFVQKYDIEDLLRLICPRPLLVLSASEDVFSQDATSICQAIRPDYVSARAPQALVHQHYEGAHALTEERFECIVDWLEQQFKNKS